MNRVVNVMRMQLINKWIFIGIPLIIIAGAFGLSWVILAVIPADEGAIVGASQAVVWYFFALGIQALTLTFPFSQGLSITRRAFFAGTLGLFAIIAFLTALIYGLLGIVEQATDGWGIGGGIFYLPWVSEGPWYQPVTFYFMAMMVLFLIGFWGATIYKRWQTTGLLLAGISSALIAVGAVLFATWQDLWPQVGGFLAGQTQMSVAGWLAVVTLALSGGSYLTLRRAVP